MSDAPKHPAELAIVEQLKIYYEAEMRLMLLREHLGELARDLASIPGRLDRLKIVRDLYWNHDAVRVDDLTVGLLADWDGEARAPAAAVGVEKLARTYGDRMRKLCGPLGHVECCREGCSNPVPINSRAERDKVARGRGGCCSDCLRKSVVYVTEEQLEAEKRAQEVREQKRARRLAELEAASGLDTEELAELFELMANRHWGR